MKARREKRLLAKLSSSTSASLLKQYGETEPVNIFHVLLFFSVKCANILDHVENAITLVAIILAAITLAATTLAAITLAAITVTAITLVQQR